MTKEMVLERKSNLVMPSHYVELDSEEMSYVEGGGRIKITISVNPSATLGGVAANAIVGFLSGYCAAKLTKSGALSGVVGAIVGLVAGSLLGALLGTFLSKYLGTGISYTLINVKTLFVNFSLDIDLTEVFKTIASIGGGGLGGYAAGLAYGALTA